MASPEVQFFVDEYKSTLEEARTTCEFGRLYDRLFAIPFHIDPPDLEGEFYGALWIPPVQLQGIVRHTEHWRGYEEFRNTLSRFKQVFGVERFIGGASFRGYLEVIAVDPEEIALTVHDSPFIDEEIKHQVEADFGVAVTVTAG